MRVRAALATLVCGAFLAYVGVDISSAQTGKESSDIIKVRDDLKLQEQRLLNQYKEFEDQLHRLKRRLSTSKDPDDRAKAELLEKVIEKARDESIIIQFEQINAALKEQKFTNITEVKLLMEKTNKLALDLQGLLALMREDPNYNAAREKAKVYKELLEKLDQAIREQRDVQIRTDLGKAETKELKKAQEKVTQLTGEIAKAIEAQGGEGGEAKNMKGESKAGEAKGDGKSGESKDGGKEGKAGESKGKEGGEAGKSGDPKSGDPKSGEPKDGKGDAKGSEGSKSGEGADSKSKSGEGSDSKSGSKGSKGSEGAAGPKSGGKEGDKGKEGGAKDGGEKSPMKEKTEPGEAKSGEKSGDAGKEGAKSKSGEGSKAESGAKGSKGSDSKSDSKEGSKGAESKGDSKSGESSGGKSSSKGSPSESGGEGSKSKSGPQDSKKEQNMIGKKQVQDAEGYEKSAENKIEKKDLRGASDDQGQAVKNLEDAKKKLEDLLRQVREEELERLLAALQARCEKMLAMQVRVYNETVDIHKVVQTHADKQPDREDKLRAIKQGKEEQDIVLEATKAIQMLEAEGTAVAFPEVFQQVREDMKIVQRRLETSDVGTVTQAIETDIIDTLKEMVEALKKAREENKDKKDSDSKPGEGKSGGPQDQKLLDQIAELKMIRSMQVRVNTRTTTYGRMYVERDGEQARDANIRRELQNLGDRQERITEITTRIAKGDNK